MCTKSFLNMTHYARIDLTWEEQAIYVLNYFRFVVADKFLEHMLMLYIVPAGNSLCYIALF